MPPKPGKRGGGAKKVGAGAAKGGSSKRTTGAGAAKKSGGAARAGGAKPKAGSRNHGVGPIFIHSSRSHLATGSSMDQIRPVGDSSSFGLKPRGDVKRNTGTVTPVLLRSPKESSEGDGLTSKGDFRIKNFSSAATTAVKENMRKSITNLFFSSKGKNPTSSFKTDTSKVNINKDPSLPQKSDHFKAISFKAIPFKSDRFQDNRQVELDKRQLNYDMPNLSSSNVHQSNLSPIVSEDSLTSAKRKVDSYR